MEARRKRLAKLVHIQEQVKALHEARTAQHRLAAIAARDDADAIAARADAEDGLAPLFPDLYHRHVAKAQAREAQETERADQQALLAAKAGMRGDIVARSHRDVSNRLERARLQKEILEFVERGTTKSK